MKNLHIRIGSLLISILTAYIIYILNIPNPMMILIIPVVFFTYIDGYISGAISGFVALLYSLYFFSNSDQLFTYDALNLQKVLTIIFAVSVIVILVGRLRSHRDHLYEELERTNRNFQEILSKMDIQLLVTEPDTDIILFANEKMNQNYQIDYDPTGRPCWEVYYNKEQRCEFCPIQQLFDKEKETIQWELKNPLTGRCYQNRDSLIKWTDGRIVHLLESVDITHLRQIQEELLVAKEQAEASTKTKSEFLSKISHEIRTPMNAIIGMNEIAKRSDNVEQIHYCLSKIGDASAHLLELINDVLDMSKIEAGKLELLYSDFPLERVLRRVCNVTNFKMEQNQQTFRLIIDRDVPAAIISDQQRLAQVLTNFLSNAMKFTPEYGSITLRIHNTGCDGDLYTLLFEVIDTGIGISEENLGRLWQSFEQADSSITQQYGGTGLGLAISRNIITMLGGTVGVDSKEGEGSRFYFTLPVEKGLSTYQSPLDETINWSTIKMLIVDDAPEVLDYFSTIAESIGAFYKTLSDPHQAIDYIREYGLNIIFIDWKMPGLDGIELTRQIRQEFGDNIIVIMISASEWMDIEHEAKKAGVNSFIQKPIFPSTIIDCINEMLSQSGQITARRQEENIDGIFTGKTILLVEDVEINREILITMLGNTGLTIDCAENGKIAVEKFLSDEMTYDAILMDIQMPVMSGYEAAGKIRSSKKPQAKHIPIIALTANAFQEDVQKCIAAGMDDHLAKPLDFDDMLQKLNQYLFQ